MVLEGIARYTYEIIKRLVQAHPEHQYYFYFDRTYDDAYIFSDRVVPKVIHPPARHAVLFYLWFEFGIKKALTKDEIDVFISLDGFLCLNTTIPQVLAIHDLYYMHHPENIPFINRWYYRIFMPKFIRKAKYLFAVSQFVKNDIIKYFPDISRDRIHIAYNALPSHFSQGITDQKPELNFPYFVVPGAIHARKNTQNVLLAFEEFMMKSGLNCKIVLVGKIMGKLNPDLQILWNRMVDKGTLIHISNADNAKMIQWISHSKALVYASQFEGFGIPVLEGFACGVPVITSNTTSLVEVAGDAAIMVDPFDPASICQGMLKAVKDIEEVQSLITKGKERIKDFDWNQSMEVIYQAVKMCMIEEAKPTSQKA